MCDLPNSDMRRDPWRIGADAIHIEAGASLEDTKRGIALANMQGMAIKFDVENLTGENLAVGGSEGPFATDGPTGDGITL